MRCTTNMILKHEFLWNRCSTVSLYLIIMSLPCMHIYLSVWYDDCCCKIAFIPFLTPPLKLAPFACLSMFLSTDFSQKKRMSVQIFTKLLAFEFSWPASVWRRDSETDWNGEEGKRRDDNKVQSSSSETWRKSLVDLKRNDQPWSWWNQLRLLANLCRHW